MTAFTDATTNLSSVLGIIDAELDRLISEDCFGNKSTMGMKAKYAHIVLSEVRESIVGLGS